MAKKTYTVTLQLPDGTRKYYRGKTKKEAEKKRDEAKVQIGMGVNLSDDTTVNELADLWFRLYKKDQLHKRSEETVQATLRRYILPMLGKMSAREVKPIHIQQLMTSVSKYSKSTQKKVLQATRNIFSVAVDNGIIVKSPISSQTKAGGSEPKEQVPLTESQCRALLKAVEGTKVYPLVLLLMYSGLRIGEALGLMWSDVDFEQGTVTVSRSLVFPDDNRAGELNSEMKTPAAHRTIPLPWPAVEVLKKEKAAAKSVWIFSKQNGDHHSYDSFRALWRLIDYRSTVKRKAQQREIVERTLDFSVHPHLLRHTCVTRWFEQGLDIKEIQYLAGHATEEITLRIYTHYRHQQRHEETANKIRGMAVAL